MNKKRALLTMGMTLALLTTGCWDYIELEFIDFVMGVGVDAVEPQFDLVVEIIKVSDQPETQFLPVVLTTKGGGFFSAGRSLSKLAGIRLFWVHAKVFIIAEEVARQGALPAVEEALRDPDLRTSVLVYVAKGHTAEEVFKSNAPITDSISDHLVNIAEFHHRIPTCYNQELWQFREALQTSGLAPVLPTICLVGEGAQEIPQVEGTALFKGDQMIGWIDGEETRLYSMLRGLKDRGPLIVDVDLEDQRGQLSFEIRGNQVKIKPIEREGRPSFSVEIGLQLDLSELGTLDIKYEDPSVKQRLEKQVNTTVRERVQDLIEKIQELETDVFGFGRLLKKRKQQIWRAYEANWDQVFATLEITVAVKSKIVSTGVLAMPLKTRD